MNLGRLLFALLLIACDPVPVVDSECRETPRLNRQVAFKVHDYPVYQDVYAYRFELEAESRQIEFDDYRAAIEGKDGIPDALEHLKGFRMLCEDPRGFKSIQK